jgi:DNA-binding response OmpR family regulator
MSSNPRSRADVQRSPRVVLALPESDAMKELADTLHRAGFLPHKTPSPETASLAVAYRDPVAILIDASFLKASGFRFLDSIRTAARDVPVLVVADADDEATRLRALMLGAEDCLVRPFAPQEAVLRLRRVVERALAHRAMLRERETVTRRADGFREDAAVLRAQLRRTVTMLQHAIDFHQRLDLNAGLETITGGLLRNLSVQIGVGRMAYLAPSHPGATWMVPRASLGIPSWMTEGLRIPLEGELGALFEATGAPLVVDRLRPLPALRLEAGILSAAGITAAIPMLSRGRLSGAVLLGETRSGDVPDQEALRLAQFLASALAPALEVLAGSLTHP